MTKASSPETADTLLDRVAQKAIADMAEMIGDGVSEDLTSMDIAGNCWICVLHRLSEEGVINGRAD